MEDLSYGDILNGGTGQFESLIQYLESEIKACSEVPSEMAQQFESLKNHMIDEYRNSNEELATHFDSDGKKTLQDFDIATGLGPKISNNIEPPNIVEQIMALLGGKDPRWKSTVDLVVYLNGKTQMESVNRVHHWLNHLGFYRDKRIKDLRQFTASFSDMTHAVYASYCNILYTTDSRLMRKAFASYEHTQAKATVRNPDY